MLLSTVYTFLVMGVFSSETTNDENTFAMTQGRYFEKITEFTIIDGWVALQHEDDIYPMLNVVRSLYLYYSRHRAGIPFTFLADPVFINNVNTLSRVFEYKPKHTRPDGLAAILHDVEEELKRQSVAKQLAISFYERSRQRSGSSREQNDDQVVPSSPSLPSDDSDSYGTPDTEPLDQSFDGFNSSDDSDSSNQDNNTTVATPNSSMTTVESTTVMVPEEEDQNQENRDPDNGDPNNNAESFVNQQQRPRTPLRQLTTRRTTFSDDVLNAMRPPTNRRRRRFVVNQMPLIPSLRSRYYRREKIVVAHNMQNVPIEWYSEQASPFDSKEPVLIQTDENNVKQLIKFLVSKTQEEMAKGHATVKLGLERTLQTEEVRMYVGYWLEHLTTKLKHSAEGKAMSYLPHDSLLKAMREIEQRLRQDVYDDIYDFTNMTNIAKERMPYIITKQGYNYKTIYYVPRQRKHLVAYQLKGDNRQIKYQDRLFDMTFKPNNTIAILRSLETQPSTRRTARQVLPTYEGAIPTIEKLQKKCTKIKKFYCAVDRLRPVIDICLKALVLKQPDAFEKCAGKLEKGSQRIVRIALNKFQFFTKNKNKNVNKIVACTKDANEFAVPPTGLATIQLNNTCRKVFVNNRKFEYEPKKDLCVVNENPCTKKVADTIPSDDLIELMNKLINNPLQDSIEIITNLTNMNFWRIYKTQIIITTIIVLLILTTGCVMVTLFKVVRNGFQCCLPARAVNRADEHELDPLNRATLSSVSDPERPVVIPQTVSLPLSEVQGINIQMLSNDRPQSIAEGSVNTGSKKENPPPYLP